MIPNDYGMIVMIYAICLVVLLMVYVWSSLALSAVFRKAGAPANHAWIPVMNWFTLAKIGGRPESPWLLFVPFYGIYVLYLFVASVSNRFGRSNGFGLFGTILFPVWASILGWGSARWMGAVATPSAPSAAWMNPQQDAMSAHPDQLSWLDQSRSSVAAVPPPPAAEQSPAGQNTWDPFAPLGGSLRAEQPVAQIPAPPAPSAASASNDAVAPSFVPPAVSAQAPAPAAQPAAQPVAPVIPPVPPVMPTTFGNPGSTRMHEDSEVVAQARRAQAMTPPPLPPLPESFDVPAPPIVVPAAPAIIPAPPVPLSGSVPVVEGTSFEDSEWMQNSLSTGIANVATPVSASDSVSTQEVEDDVWAPRLRRTELEGDDVSDPAESVWSNSASVSAISAIESSVEVSAVAAVPDAGTPRAARTSVSAHHANAGVPSDEGIDDQTIVAARRRSTWNLQLPVGTSVALTSDYVILGRKPDDEPEFPSAQLISVADGTRTISKTHAVLALVDGAWTITDLGSTNGVVLIDESGAERELAPHQPAVLTTRFLLGDAELRIEAASE
ncbi:DUF5684 domain-containing protein [Microbacterium sp. NC79]|uniref:DUF5684 domain-containing protein n=1 Tax=Microbacterium sp. NC79 TaxID=2851009 RepID=UPI001C2C7780|nr:DUF5684 domain-containing protein [Microbacterium sp. NC79]MBV0894035.1 FHA domain-containing protein [Microbacterium sp. NC79]